MIRRLALLGLVAFACHAGAQTVLHYKEGQQVDPQDVAQILGQGATPEAPGTTRSIRLLGDDGATAAPSPSSTAGGGAAVPGALSLPIRFDFGSTGLSRSAQTQLESLAKGIQLLPAGRAVVIEGHTDAVGSDDYNDRLSLRRAGVVKQYLVQHYGIAAARLKARGLGKRQPVSSDPFAAENRRVQFYGA